MIPRRVRTAVLIAFVCHGLFILTARYRLSYDAFTHMLFANHYAENWFSLWETRWYAGFPIVSYPPLTHQLIAIFIPIFGFDKAFALVLWGVTSLFPLGIFVFSRIFTGRSSASYAALASAVLLPIYITAYIFGQLPFLMSTLTALFAAASFNRYLREGGIHNFVLSITLVATSMAMHHATLLAQPFFIFAVFANNLLRPERSKIISDSGFNIVFKDSVTSVLFKRLFAFIAFAVSASILVILPFWQWGAGQIMQTPIDHLSRHNFIADPLALAIFFFPLYGPLIVVIPFLFRKWHPRFVGLLISFTVLFLLGLGGTTPLPHIFFGDAWEWLTYDRFAFWASLTLTPFFGILFIGLKKKFRLALNLWFGTYRINIISTVTFFVFTATALGGWFTPLIVPLQPKVINMQPIVDFLNAGDNSQWRYLTFGFGDQFAFLNLLTKATTIDGSYHTARTLPELRDSGIGQIDTSYWALNGMTAIIPILKNSGKYSVRWGFVNPSIVETKQSPRGKIQRSPFISVLNELGWKKIKTLDNGVLVYENSNAVPLIPGKTPDAPPIISFLWGVIPILTFVTGSALGLLRVYPIQAEGIIRKIYSLTIGLLPLSFCFWAYRVIGEFSHARVYFTYDNALFFVSDGLAVIAIVLWVTVKISQPSFSLRRSFHQIVFSTAKCGFILFLFAFCSITTLSLLWSNDWRTSLYISLHFWLVYFLVLSLRDWHEAWKAAMLGLCAALVIQICAGFTGFALQSTAFLQPLNLKWPGNLEPSMHGASVVQLANGLRILRAYGTLPHPNILGGLVFITLLGPASLFLTSSKPNYPALILLCLGIFLIGLTFSRSAWLALIAFVFILTLKLKYLDSKRFFLLILSISLTAILALYPFRDLVFARIGNSEISTEQNSILGRLWFTRQAMDMIQKHPVGGVGIGSFVLELSKTAVDGAPIEPVHNILFLETAELGLIGLTVIVSLFISIAISIIKLKSPKATLAGATLIGFGVISLFDHYLWTLAPGRLMLGFALGLWAGQVEHDA